MRLRGDGPKRAFHERLQRRLPAVRTAVGRRRLADTKRCRGGGVGGGGRGLAVLPVIPEPPPSFSSGGLVKGKGVLCTARALVSGPPSVPCAQTPPPKTPAAPPHVVCLQAVSGLTPSLRVGATALYLTFSAASSSSAWPSPGTYSPSTDPFGNASNASPSPSPGAGDDDSYAPGPRAAWLPKGPGTGPCGGPLRGGCAPRVRRAAGPLAEGHWRRSFGRARPF